MSAYAGAIVALLCWASACSGALLSEKGTPYSSMLGQGSFGSLAFVLLGSGLVVGAVFFLYEAASSKATRQLSVELLLGAVASVLLGYGSLYLMQASGIYV